MSLPELMNQFLGTSSDIGKPSIPVSKSPGSVISELSNKLPGGLAGGAVAGGLMALLVGNKSARKVAGKTATYGGAALLGGLAYKAYKNWQDDSIPASSANIQEEAEFEQQALLHAKDGGVNAKYEPTLMKAMIAAARSDGHIDDTEQKRIFKAVNEMNMNSDMKGRVLDLFSEPISVLEITQELETLEERSEVYLASCLVIDLDDTAEYAHLAKLTQALNLPKGLEQQLRAQAKQVLLTTI
jgi:uncharacterized membrane protein YebE (DUF533 family)